MQPFCNHVRIKLRTANAFPQEQTYLSLACMLSFTTKQSALWKQTLSFVWELRLKVAQGMPSPIFLVRHWYPSHKVTPAFYLSEYDSVFDWEWNRKAPVSLVWAQLTLTAPWALMAETSASKAKIQSNQLCAILPMAPVVPGMCSTLLEGREVSTKTPVWGVTATHEPGHVGRLGF